MRLTHDQRVEIDACVAALVRRMKEWDLTDPESVDMVADHVTDRLNQTFGDPREEESGETGTAGTT